MSDERCEITELLIDQCGCSQHRNSEARGLAEYRIGPRTEAQRDGICAYNPDHAIIAGDTIGLLITNDRDVSLSGHRGVATVADEHGWVCPKCVREVDSQ